MGKTDFDIRILELHLYILRIEILQHQCGDQLPVSTIRLRAHANKIKF